MSVELVSTGGAEPAATKTDLMLLGILGEKPMHGYEIAEKLSDPKMAAWIRLGRTSIYYSLNRMQKRGLIEKHTEKIGGKPERTVFSITDAGRQAFVQGLEDSLGGASEGFDEFDIALYFSTQLDSERAKKHIAKRLQGLSGQVAMLVQLSESPESRQYPEVGLVLAHRIAVLRADLEFLDGHFGRLSAASDSHGISGTLEGGRLADVLLGLSAAGRSGVLTVALPGGGLHPALDVGFCLADGDLYGLLSHEGDVTVALQEVFQSSRGRYEFRSSDAYEADAVPTGTLVGAILIGSRNVQNADLLQQMLPDGGGLLATRQGYERELIGVDLDDDELVLLGELDGYRTVAEISTALGWSVERVKKAAYPLWLVGAVVRNDRSKRDFIIAVGRYVERWREAVKLLAGEEGVRRVFADVDMAVRSAVVLDFPAVANPRRPGRVMVSRDEASEQARKYVEILHRAVSARLGDGVAEDIASGYTQRVSEADKDLLGAEQVMIG